MFSFVTNWFKSPDAADNDVNLLLLGETGVGKSTLLNAISNYFNYASFKEAQKWDVDILIPIYLNVAESSRVFGTPDENEVHDQGKSATQHVKVYVFPIKMDNKTFNLRLIDTPGVGDPRGTEQDNINLDNVLAYLATLKKLHGICFVLKSNQTRFTKFAEYYLKQILTRLDKSASQNIIFITTYSKTASYTTGETKSHCLAPLVRDIESRPPHATIPLSDHNVFCLDNEAFKALLASQDGKRYTKREVKGFETSWQVSSNEIQRLLRYVIGDASSPGLKPHDVENTISINEVRFYIEQLTTPIAEVSELIQDNIRVLDAHKKKMQQDDQTLEELKQQMHIPCVNLEVKELTQPVTVCTDPKCADIVKVNNVTQWHYKQRCHNPCYLTQVPKEMIGDPKLMSCTAMAGRPNCQQCECPWQVHMHIYKEATKVSVRKVDQNVLGVIRSKQDARFHMHKLIEDLNTRRQELEKEGETISSIVAKFSWFLQEHALTPFNDAYGRFADREVIEKLENLLSQYYNLQATFHESAKNAQGQPPGDLSLKGIQKSIAQLYKLKHMGKTIQELIQKSNACRNKETQKNFGCVTLREVVDLDKTTAERERFELTESDDDEQPRQTKASEEEYEVDVDWGKESYVSYEPKSAVIYKQSSKPRTFIDDDGFNSRQHSRRRSPDRRYDQPRNTYTQRDNFRYRTQHSRDSDDCEPVKSHRNEAMEKYDRSNYAQQRHVKKKKDRQPDVKTTFPEIILQKNTTTHHPASTTKWNTRLEDNPIKATILETPPEENTLRGADIPGTILKIMIQIVVILLDGLKQEIALNDLKTPEILPSLTNVLIQMTIVSPSQIVNQDMSKNTTIKEVKKNQDSKRTIKVKICLGVTAAEAKVMIQMTGIPKNRPEVTILTIKKSRRMIVTLVAVATKFALRLIILLDFPEADTPSPNYDKNLPLLINVTKSLRGNLNLMTTVMIPMSNFRPHFLGFVKFETANIKTKWNQKLVHGGTQKSAKNIFRQVPVQVLIHLKNCV
ncbi:hypothetical protein Zmor_015093 [Zophobas morio]|uniref:DUF8206 domain-containing protein n=1 Tax=Zophobas morio TaxID=2755281 RepID=A0AA38MGY0_9CUCU|nr:hypothetical protein Zmor_015093 [Zophobas morio]